MRNWVKLSPESLEEEWETETLDSLFFQYYAKDEVIQEVKDIFFKNFDNFTSVERINVSDIEQRDMYSGDTLEELKENTSYMNKNIDLIVENIKTGKASTPLFMLKDGNLNILGGRTRCSISNLLNVRIRGTVIDYEKMKQYFSVLREKDFIKDGLGVLVFEPKRIRLKILHDIKKTDTISDKTLGMIENWDGLDDKQISEEIEDLKKFLFHPKKNDSQEIKKDTINNNLRI